jgi:hypothetical protein
MANGYRDDLTIERREVNGDYEPSNCKWIPMEEQSRNRTNRREIMAFGESKSIPEWARDPRCPVGRITLYYRIKTGCNYELAITTPPQKKVPKSQFVRMRPD